MTGRGRNEPGERQFFPWERQSTYWHTSGSGKRQALEFATEICLGTHPLRHPCTRRRYVHPGVIPAHAAVTSTPPASSLHTPPLRPPPASFLHTPPLRPPPASFLHTPPSRPSSGVIPAKAGILTRISFYKGRAATNNYAAISSRHISYGKCDGLCVLKSLVWIRAICKPKRP